MIHFDHVTKNYGTRKVINDITCIINSGEFVSITGPSGAGKTTLMHMLIGHLKPTNGELVIDNVHIEKMNFDTRQLYRRKIGIVFQDYKLLPQKTVHENVAFAMEVCGENEDFIERRVPEVLDKVGLLERQGQYPSELSGGEQQRTAIARALVHEPSLLIADEPTGNLDIDTAMGIIKLLEEINKQGTTVILTTHNQDIVQYLNGRVIHIEAGKIVSDKMQVRKEVVSA